MTKVYVMESCPDCTEVKQRYSDKPEYELVDIGKQARSLKEFIVLRDTHPAFAKVRERGTIGIPCFVLEDGRVIISVKRYDAALTEISPDANADASAAPDSDDSAEHPSYAPGASCSLDGSGC